MPPSTPSVGPPESKGTGKKHFCIFCKKLVLNFSRHLQTNHRDKKEVEEMSLLPKGSNERMKCIDEMRGRGAIYYNNSLDITKGKLVVKRLKQTGLIGYTPCPSCKNFYKKTSLYKHYKVCACQVKTPKTLQTTSLSLCISASLTEKDSWLVNEILPGLSSKGNIRDTVINDSLLIEYGGYLCVRHRTNQHLTNMVRGKLRQMAKVLLAMRKLDNEITTLESAFKPAKYDVFMRAVDIVTGYNPTDSTYRAPSQVSHIGNNAQECANIIQARAIKNDDEVLQNRVINWLKLYKHEFYYKLGKSALNKVAERKWNKPRLVPVTDDIMKLNNNIKNTIEKAKSVLTNKFDSKAFDDLNRGLMIQIIIFNRKRIGEVEKLLVSDFNNRHNIQKGSEQYKTLSTNEKIISSRYMRMEVRGKLGRPVSLLVSKNQIEMIKMILNLRSEASVSPGNKYVFAKQGASKDTFYSAPPALRWFAQNSGAAQPGLLTGTKLRKQMATVSQAMDLTENDLAILADFMGHNITTHRNFYRMPSEVTHLARISQVLMSLEEGDTSKYAGKRLEDINVNITIDDVEEVDEADDFQDIHVERTLETHDQLDLLTQPSITTIPDSQIHPHKEENTGENSFQTPVKRRTLEKKTWKTPERHAARRIFRENIKTGRLPNMTDCLVAINQFKELKGRTVKQVKAWVYNEINRNKRK